MYEHKRVLVKPRVLAFAVPLLWALGCDAPSTTQPLPDDAGEADSNVDAGQAELICSWDTTAEELPFATGKVDGVLRGDSQNRSTKCTQQTGSGGPEKIYRLNVPDRRRITLEVRSSMNTVVAIRRACDDPLTEVACGANASMAQGPSLDAGRGGFPMPPPFPVAVDASVAFATTNFSDGALTRVLEAGQYFVIVDQEEPFGVGGPFSLKVTVEEGPAIGTCEAPRTLRAFDQVAGERLDLGVPAPRCAPIPLNQARFYAVTIPSGHILKADLNGHRMFTGEPAQAFMQLHGTCDDSQCLAADADNPFGGRTLTFANNGPSDMNALLSVGTQDSTQDDVTFTLTVQVRKPSVNATCRAATPVQDGTVLENQTLDDGAMAAVSACKGGTGGGTLFYKATLLPQQSITASLSPSPNRPFFNPTLFMFGGCEANECLAMQFGNPVLGYQNKSDQTKDIILAVSGQGRFDPRQVSEAFTLRIQMSDPPGVITTEAAPDLLVRESGSQATFKIKLNAPPRSPVSIAVTSSDPTEVTVSPASVTFTAQTWNVPAVVTLTGVDDADADGAQKATITTSAAVSEDKRFVGKDPADVVVTNQDDEPGVYSPVTNIVTTESGLKVSVPVRLNSKPSADVTLNVSSTKPLEATASSATLTFTPTNWNDYQVVTVTGLPDNVEDGEQAFELVIDGSTSTSALWTAVPALRVPGKNRVFAFAQRDPVTLSGTGRCSIGFSDWDRRIATDRAGRLYIAMVCEGKVPRFSADGGQVFIKQDVFVVTSNDGGKTFSAPTSIQLESVSNVSLAAGPDGTAYLAASEFGVGVLLRTTDAGVTWTKVPGFAPTNPGVPTVVAVNGAVVIGHNAGGIVEVFRNTSAAAGAFTLLPGVAKASSSSLMNDPNGVDIWQVAVGATFSFARSTDEGATFLSFGQAGAPIASFVQGVTVGGNVAWGYGPSRSILRVEPNVEKEWKTLLSASGHTASPALVADTSGGVTLLEPGLDGALRVRYLERNGDERVASRMLDFQSGQPSAVLLEGKTIAYTYARGNEQRFGILVWP